MRFIGRKEEIYLLNKAYDTNEYEGILVYGRRRIGKSELIKESYKNRTERVIYYECKKISEELNAVSLCEMISIVFNIPTPSFKSIDECLDFLFQISINEKIILVIDEYPYVRGLSDSLDSRIQVIIDKYKMNCKMKLILCGSYIDIMEQLLSNKNPLFGRFTYKLSVKQMNYYESKDFYPNAKVEDKVAYYSVFGGVPYYNQFIDDQLSFEDNLTNLIVSQNARLLPEAETFLLEEMNKLKNANECFLAIAMGNKKFTDILNKSNVSSSPMLSEILKKLVSMDVVEKIYPINDKSDRRSFYEISDNLSLFYYKYIFKNNSMFKIMRPLDFYTEFIMDDLHKYFIPKQFEKIAKEYIIKENKAGNIKPVLYNVGKYYYDDAKNKQNGEFDLVTYDKNGYTFYEVKYTEKPIDNSIVNEEKYQLNKLGIQYNKLGFISKNGFSLEDKNDYILIDLDTIYK